jgi:hypothetical protein
MPLAVAGGIAAVLVIVGVVAFGGNDPERSSPTTLAGPTSTTSPTTSSTATTLATSTSTSTSTTTTTTLPDAPEPGGTWTVLVYGLADNNLEPAIYWDLEEMANVPPSENLTILALVDRHAEYTEREMLGIPDWEGGKLLRVDEGRLTELADYGEIDMGDPQVFGDFLVTGAQSAPADHYAVVLWDHGAIYGIGSDESSGDRLDTQEIADALAAALPAAGIPKLDIIGFDACLMGAYEVAVAVAPYAYYLIGSEEVEPNGGWDYTAFDYVPDYPEGTALSLGREILARFIQNVGESNPEATLSLIDLNAVAAIEEEITAFSDLAAEGMDEYAAVIARERNRTMAFGSNPDPTRSFHLIDLGEFFRRIADAEPGLNEAALAAQAAIEAAVLDVRTGPVTSGATGIAAYFPPLREYWDSDYDALRPPGWTTFLDAFYAAGAAIPEEQQPDFEEVSNVAQYVLDADGLFVTADFDLAAQETAVEAVLYSGVPEEDGSITYYSEDQGLIEGITAGAIYDLTVLVLSDGEDEAIAYQDISFDENLVVFTIDVPVAYFPPGSEDWIDSLISVAYNIETDEFTETMYQLDEFAGTIGVIEPEPDGLIVPWLLREYDDGTLQWEMSSDVGLWADLDNLAWDFQVLEDGTPLYSELWVCDFGGNCDFAAVETIVGSGVAATECTNETFGFIYAYPGWMYLWDPADPTLECAYLSPWPFEAPDDVAAFDEAAVTVEVLEGDILDEALTYIENNTTTAEEVVVADLPALLATNDTPGSEIIAYVVPITTDPSGPTLVVVGWEWVAPEVDVAGAVARIVESFRFAG